MSADCAARPSPLDALTFLPHACDQLLAPFRLSVRLVTSEDYASRHDDKGKKTKRDREPEQCQSPSTQRPLEKSGTASVLDAEVSHDDEVVVTIVRDTAGHLVELGFHHCAHIPRMLMKIIALCVPYQLMLSRITVRRSSLEDFILYEMAHILAQSSITEICLDDSPVPARNYHVLLERPTQLKSLSLARCNLDDEDCIAVALKLRHPEPASRSLILLCLASNAISDSGAAALGEMLRTNRTLRHLNLSGNRVSDSAATDIFRSLARFHLTPDEIAAKRRRIFDYLKMKEIISSKCYKELAAGPPPRSPDDKNSAKRRPTNRPKRSSVTLSTASKSTAESALAVRAEAMAASLLGPLVEPFRSEETDSLERFLHSRGNMTLAYLNLAYNNLEYQSVAVLANVLRYQTDFTDKVEGGLMRVVLDGNRVPASGAPNH